MPENESTSRYTYDAFISYSRKDIKFAKQLEAELERYSPPKESGRGKRKLNIFRDIQDVVGNELVGWDGNVFAL